jgi:uncharacterized protein
MDAFSLAAANLISPPILFFALGLAAALARSDLSVPQAIAKALSLYLIMAIGFKGGAEMAAGDLTLSVAGALVAGVVLSALLPVAGFGLLMLTTRLGRIDAAAIAGHYGSISIVTFIAANDAARMLGAPGEGYMVAVAAAMEAPAILTALILAGASGRTRPDAPAEPGGRFIMLREILLNGSIVLLLGAFAVGWVTGPAGMAAVSPFFVDIFRGVLCLFLLDMGLVAGRGLLNNWRALQPAVIAFGLYFPPVGAAFGLGAAALIGLDPSSAALLMTLSASASYIAVPAALRLALPEARPAISLTLALGVTFPFNLVLGIPLYFWAARTVLG